MKDLQQGADGPRRPDRSADTSRPGGPEPAGPPPDTVPADGPPEAAGEAEVRGAAEAEGAGEQPGERPGDQRDEASEVRELFSKLRPLLDGPGIVDGPAEADGSASAEGAAEADASASADGAGRAGEAGEAGEPGGSGACSGGPARSGGRAAPGGHPARGGSGNTEHTGKTEHTDSAGSDRRQTAGPDGAMDEQALRRLLHTVVDDLEPSRDALEQLRHAVPARRARKRQALVGAAAAVLLAGTAVPGLIHVTSSGGTSQDPSANAASSQHTAGEAEGPRSGPGDDKVAERHPGRVAEQEKDEKAAEDGGKGELSREGQGSTVGGTGATPSQGSMAASSPRCERAQLGGGTAAKGEPDAEGKIYGSFRVVNTSSTTCTVSGPGTVTAVHQGAAAPVPVIDHTLGNAATALPDPAAETRQLVLEPGQAYEVRFAWVPASGSGGCPSPGTSPDPGSGSGGSGGSGGEGEGTEGSQTLGQPTEDTTPETGSVELSYTPETGQPVAASTVITGVCSGTVYRTGVLAA
ncbi:hypothetical protein [Streptomyces zingiberis]|uniref:DUF4232 domain-containing protein n=1 Tax=Streptomyces zingiberis TaxID=2053010 RepID=A0ABX1BV37_9ACTN|nr:hypothetical protein [Streptomyces zingiberis]NJP99123.1 hypothetical protein [Streptomyces zingiberis]